MSVKTGSLSTIKPVSLREAGTNETVLLDAMTVRLPNSLVHSNHHLLNPDWAGQQYFGTYKRRICMVNDVSLIRLGSEYVVRSFDVDTCLVHAGNLVVAEQVPPWLESFDDEKFAEIFGSSFEEVWVDDEVVIIGRFGIGTWGHWLGELLPKIVCLEAKYPGRFTYFLPSFVTEPQNSRTIWMTIFESLIFYGVDHNRIFPAQQRTLYRFNTTFAITRVWEKHTFHPGALELMRSRPWMGLPAEESSAISRISLLRTDARMRRITNFTEVEYILKSRGYASCRPGELTFREQVRLFSGAQFIAGILGSGFTGMIYSPVNVRALSMCAHNWGDNFFYALMQNRQATFVDIRGYVELKDESDTKAGMGEFLIDIGDLRKGLEALDEAPAWFEDTGINGPVLI